MERVLADYRALLATVDAWFGRCLVASGDAVCCRRGCAACCRGTFDITLLDAALLQQGFALLDAGTRRDVLGRVEKRLEKLRQVRPGFGSPYVLNTIPEAEWEALMPEEDETPCPLLAPGGDCLVYDHRPMTCRLHGLPQVDLCGEVVHDEWCTLNFAGENPLLRPDLRWEFRRTFAREFALLAEFLACLPGCRARGLDTLLPVALLIDFPGTDWQALPPAT